MRLGTGELLLLLVALLALGLAGARKQVDNAIDDERRVARDFFESTLIGLMQQRRLFLDGFGNATELLQKQFNADDTGEARGRKKKLKQMNRTLIAIVMAYTLKFLFLVPTFIGTLVLFKFTVGIAGFFYALFAAVLGLDHHHPHER